MTTAYSPFNPRTLAMITVIMVLGALAMIWPGIIALFLGGFLLFKSCSADQEIVGLSWAEIGNLSIVFGS